jgi:hypothetical protein
MYIKILGVGHTSASTSTFFRIATDYEAQMAVQDPSLIRWAQRERVGLLALHGVDLRPLDRLVDIGRQLAEYRAVITARAFAASQRRLRSR